MNRRRIAIAIATVVLSGIVALAFLVWPKSAEEGSKPTRKPNAIVFNERYLKSDLLAISYTKAFVESDDQLYGNILAKDDPRVPGLEDGYHMFPNRFTDIGERYAIYRYVSADGTLSYLILAFNSDYQRDEMRFIKIVREGNEWKALTVSEITSPSEVSVIHEYKQ